MTILSLPVERSALKAAEPKPAMRTAAEEELPPLWVLLLLPVAVVLIPLCIGVSRLTKAFQYRS